MLPASLPTWMNPGLPSCRPASARYKVVTLCPPAFCARPASEYLKLPGILARSICNADRKVFTALPSGPVSSGRITTSVASPGSRVTRFRMPPSATSSCAEIRTFEYTPVH